MVQPWRASRKERSRGHSRASSAKARRPPTDFQYGEIKSQKNPGKPRSVSGLAQLLNVLSSAERNETRKHSRGDFTVAIQWTNVYTSSIPVPYPPRHRLPYFEATTPLGENRRTKPFERSRQRPRLKWAAVYSDGIRSEQLYFIVRTQNRAFHACFSCVFLRGNIRQKFSRPVRFRSSAKTPTCDCPLGLFRWNTSTEILWSPHPMKPHSGRGRGAPSCGLNYRTSWKTRELFQTGTNSL